MLDGSRMTMAACGGPSPSSFCTWIIWGPPVLDGVSTFGAATGARGGGAAAGAAAAVTFGVETATSCGLRNGFSRSAIAAETPTTASTTTLAATMPALTLPTARG